MKTKDLIRKLQLIDPRGEMHVVVENVDINSIHSAPAYYDGVCEQLVRDADGDVVGVKLKASGDKIRIRIESIEDLLWDNPDLPVDCSELDFFVNSTRRESYEKWVENTRKEIKRENEKYDEWYMNKLSSAFSQYQTSKDLNELDKEIGGLIRRGDKKAIEFLKSKSWSDTILDDWINETVPEKC